LRSEPAPLLSLILAGNGGLGHGDNTSQPRPALVETLQQAGQRVTQVAVGSRHMFALTSAGGVWSWGHTEYGRCGNGKRKQPLPEPIELLTGHHVVHVASGQQHGLAATAAGDVWVWGKNDAGQLGVGGSVLMDLNTMEEFPLRLELEGDDAYRFMGAVVAVAAGSNHSLALTRSGAVFQWGGRTFLQPQAVEYGYLRPQEDEGLAGAGSAGSSDKGGSIKLKGAKVRGCCTSSPPPAFWEPGASALLPACRATCRLPRGKAFPA